MKKIFLIIVIIIARMGMHAQLQPSEDMRGWTVLFEDDMATLNSNLWYKSHNAVHGSGNSEEPQVYMQENVTNSNGKLVLTARKVSSYVSHPNNSNCHYNNHHQYTSGQICSNNTYQYGYYEIYAKLPSGRGIWPAFWFWQMDDNPTAPWYNEIDVFEGNGVITDRLFTNRFWDFTLPLYNPNNCEEREHFCNYSQGYHWYGIKWDKNRVMWYFDRQCVREDFNTYGGYGIQHPLNIIINLALRPPEWEHGINSNTPNTCYMYIDHVNAYHLDCSDKNVVQNEISDFSTYNYKVKKSITLSGATTLPSNGNIVLYATDYVRLNAGFSVPLGTEFTIDTCDECN